MTQKIVKFLTAGSVDDGKSTLIGRLLYDTKSLHQDQIAEVIKSTDKSFDNGDIDFSLFLDGLISEREQRITIDVAYRYFVHEGNKFIIADAPGHEQYTKNMAVAAANSDIAIILIDAKKTIVNGILPQTIRHSHIINLFGIKNIIIAINKMDLISYDEKTFETIKNQYLQQNSDLNFDNIYFVPIAAALGENIIEKSTHIPWYKGETIINYLLQINTDHQISTKNSLRLQIQTMAKYQDKRHYYGHLSSGKIKVGDEVIFYPQKKTAKITNIIYSEAEVSEVENSASIAVVLDREIDAGRGNLVAESNKDNPLFTNQFDAHLVWFSDVSFKTGSSSEYLIKINHNYIRAMIKKVNYLVNFFDEPDIDHKTINQNQIASVNFLLAENIAFDLFENNHQTGSFLLIDKNTNETLACGIIKNQ